ncbi:hypothetical protein M8W91_001512 [Salmonella enterica]|nr:hypothetical protein [Salmonella enterica]EJF5855435.1 hypothetical protein [Salmonella enterica]EJF5945788.1 hypothetical protein [Salmonella enterica]EJF6157188.1 hypothetical protein [Salmonella enterica]EJF6374715.1 hypothetical protein [Salmonella enterica]
MKWLLFLIPLLLYSFQSQAVIRNNSSVTPSQCAARPVLYSVGMPNYWNDSNDRTHAYYEGCEYIQKGLALDLPSGYFGDWYPTGKVQPGPGEGSGSHPGNGSDDVDLSLMGSPVMDFSNLKVYKKKGDSSGGKNSLLYNGALYSVSYNSAQDVTTYKPVSFDSQQKQPFKSILDNVSSSTTQVINNYNIQIKKLQDSRSVISAYLNSRPGDKDKYFNDYQSALNLLRVYSQLISSAEMDVSRINSLGYAPVIVRFDPSRPKQYYLYDTDGASNCGFDFSYCDPVDVKKIVYHNKNILSDLKKKYYNLSDSDFIYSESDVYTPVKLNFNVNSATYFTGNDFFFKPSNTYLRSARFGYNPPSPLPFMDFSQSADDDSGNPDDSGDSGGDVTPPDPGGDGGGGVTPPVPGGDGGGGGVVPPSPGGGGGTDNPDTSQCKPGAPDWPDCDDQSGQSGGGDDSGGSDSGGDNPGTGGGGTPGGGGGGHGSGGDGHGGGNTDGDGDALLEEVKRFHADVNAALNPDNVTVPDFNGKDVDLSGMQSDIDKQGEEQGAAWADGAKQLESTLNGITGNLPSTKLDMSKVIPGGIPGVCRPWEFDIVIGLPDGKQLKQHVVMTDFCTWYDTYIRPFVTWVFNFITAVAVFNILYKGLRTIS